MVDLRANPLRSLVFACLALFTAAPCPLTHASQYEQRMGLSHAWTDYPNWENAFLSGNGRMGIMVFGNPLEETVIFNDRGFNLSNGSTRSFATVSGADLRTIRDECASGDFADADNLAATAPQYRGGGDGSRHPGFGMFISIPPSGEVRDYSRTCDFRTGEITVQWGDTRGDWSRKAFVSRADDVAVQLLTAPTSGALSCAVRLGVSDPMGLPKSMVIKTSAAPAQLAILARYNPRLDAGYEGTTRVIVTGGTCTVTNDVLHVDGARALLLLTRTAKYRDHCEAQWGRMGPALDALPADYTALLRRHLAIHQSIYDRVRLDLGATAQERAKTNEELLSEQMASPNPVPALWERIFDAGRYYFLSASGTATPPDLLGIWTADCRAGWGGYYHLDANLNLQIGGGNIGDMP
ncbi:MAG TPA: glycoside hydrolase N-terminal domain-containing protein, partial [Chthoniobacteraceae bacterium]|nr:glycoside hydrolase N-terminal domain-containing protein [Chthoniobacteraceae bacterium]